jgi:hypothetical protein
MGKKSLKKTKYFLLIFIIIIPFAIYWLKCFLGINVSDLYSLSNYFPFKYFQRNDIIKNTFPGIIINESFDTYSIIRKWSDIWTEDKGNVELSYSRNETDSSRCLLIRNLSNQSWSYSYSKIIEVKKNNVFIFCTSIKLYGENLTGKAGFTILDENHKVIKWNYFSEETKITNEWINLQREFTISENIRYIQFRLSGTGSGDFFYDDIKISKKL